METDAQTAWAEAQVTQANVGSDLMRVSSSQRRPSAFFVVLLVLVVPIWGLSRFVGVIGSLRIPVTDLMLAFTPLIAASILVFRYQGHRELVLFLRRASQYRRLAHSIWINPALFLAPLIYALAFFALHLWGDTGRPVVQFPEILVLAGIIFLLAVGEELGWTGYLLDPLQVRFGPLGASLIIAIPWWLGHIPSILAIGGTPMDIVWWLPGALALRVLMTWLYNGAGRSTAAVVLFHTSLNVWRLVFYPTISTHYDPRYQIAGYAIASVMALLVVMSWGAKGLTGQTVSKDDQ